jgi:GT2 family glycosyltransferase
MTAKPLITTIIPTYKRPQTLKRAIQSVLNQTFPAFQVCVYDDASNDDTKTVVSELAKTDSRVKYYCHEENIGMFANWNFGLKEVNTLFFSFLSDDDLLLPNFFESAMQSLGSNAEVMFYAGSTITIDDAKIINIAKDYGRFGYFPPPRGLLEIVNTNGLIWNSIVFRSEVIGREGTIDTKTCAASDIDFVLRIAAHHAIIISKEPGAIFVSHSQSLSSTTSDLRFMWPGFQHMWNKIMSDESLPLDVRVHVKTKLNEWLCYQLRLLGERAHARRESDNVHAIAELQARVCNDKTKSRILIGMSKLQELSEPAFRFVSCLRGVFFLITSFCAILAHKIRQKQLQERYGKYLQYLL